MIIRFGILSFFLLAFSLHAHAQESTLLEGNIMDATSKSPLVAVNIFDLTSNTGTFSEADGSFKLNIKKVPATLIFSFIGYENYRLEINSIPDTTLQISLQQSSLSLPAIEVIAEPKVEKLSAPTFTVKDFIIEEDKILLVKYGGMAVGHLLELRDLEGHVIHSIPVKVKGVIESMHQSCLGNIYLLGNQEAVELDISSNKISLVSKHHIEAFNQYLKPCIEASDEYVYLKRKELREQLIHYDFISRVDKKIQNTVTIGDPVNLKLMREELGRYSTSESYYTASVGHPDDPSLMRPEKYDAWIGIFYKPIFSPLYKVEKEICLFNHTLGFLRFYTHEGNFKRQLPITYHQDKNWEKKILKDKKTGKFYTVYKDTIHKKFYEINLKDGSVKPAFKITSGFIEKMVIYNGYLYYQDSGILPGTVNRVLHRVAIQ